MDLQAQIQNYTLTCTNVTSQAALANAADAIDRCIIDLKQLETDCQDPTFTDWDTLVSLAQDSCTDYDSALMDEQAAIAIQEGNYAFGNTLWKEG